MGKPWNAKGNGKGYCPTTSAAERALLEGYRSGLGAKQQGSNGKGGGKGTAAGKGWGKGYEQEKEKKEDRTCQRQGCRAAEKKHATYGGGTRCFCCGLSMAATVPVEQLVQWAMDLRLEQEKTKRADSDTTTKSTSQGAPKSPGGAAPPAATTPEELALLRTERLALLKAAKEGTTPKATAVQEVARVFIEVAQTREKITVDPETVTAAKGLDTRAASVLTSLAEENLPSATSLKTATDIVDGMLAKSNKAAQGKSEAHEALQTTRALISTMRSGGSPEDDEVLKLLLSRELKQAKEARALDDKAPSQMSRLSALQSLRADYARELTRQADGRTLGAAKAAERAAERSKVANQLLEVATRLRDTLETKQDFLHVSHLKRTQLKADQGEAVLQLLDEKIEAVEMEDVLFEDPVEEHDSPAATATENDRDEARRLSSLLQQQLAQLQRAASQAEHAAAEVVVDAQPQPTADQAWHDLHLDFPAEVSQLPASDTMSAELKEAATKLSALLQAVPWGSTLPSVQFVHLAVLPCHMHGMVGDTIWQACWGDRHASVTSQHAVPFKLLNIAKTVAQEIALAPTQAQKTDANERYTAVVREAATRREKGGPY